MRSLGRYIIYFVKTTPTDTDEILQIAPTFGQVPPSTFPGVTDYNLDKILVLPPNTKAIIRKVEAQGYPHSLYVEYLPNFQDTTTVVTLYATYLSSPGKVVEEPIIETPLSSGAGAIRLHAVVPTGAPAGPLEGYIEIEIVAEA